MGVIFPKVLQYLRCAVVILSRLINNGFSLRRLRVSNFSSLLLLLTVHAAHRHLLAMIVDYITFWETRTTEENGVSNLLGGVTVDGTVAWSTAVCSFDWSMMAASAAT